MAPIVVEVASDEVGHELASLVDENRRHNVLGRLVVLVLVDALVGPPLACAVLAKADGAGTNREELGRGVGARKQGEGRRELCACMDVLGIGSRQETVSMWVAVQKKWTQRREKSSP